MGSLENNMVMAALKNQYEFIINDCTLLGGRNFHDNYVIKTNMGKYFVRVFRNGVRELTEISFEIDLINHLRNKGISVAFPIPRKDKSYITQFNTSKEMRHIVVFSFATGEFPEPTNEVSYLFGKFIAEFQNMSNHFVTNHSRSYEFDLEQIIDKPMELIRPMLQYREADLNYLEELAVIMKNKINNLPLDLLSKGPCHGDLHLMNMYINKQNEFTLFDFDCCSNGLQIYDLGTIRWEFAFCDDLWDLFLKGYSEFRELNYAELEAIPLFATLRNYWAIGHNLTYRDIFEIKQFDDDYWDNNLKFIKKWVEKNKYM